MVNYCCVKGCGRNNKTNKQIHYYGFPKEKHRQEEWLRAIGREDLLVKNVRLTNRVCSRHFAPNSIKNTHLCADAMPTLCLPNSINDSEDEIKEEKSPHENVVCNSCYDRIQGFRYKCLSCKDFDLCSKCETFEVHSEHYMLRIPKPAKFKIVENVLSKCKSMLNIHEENESYNTADISSDDDIPIKTYMKQYDSGIDLAEDVKSKIRDEVSRALSVNPSTESRPMKRSKKPLKRKSKRTQASQTEDMSDVERGGGDEVTTIPEVAFADVNDIQSVQTMDIKDEMPILLSQLLRNEPEPQQLADPAPEVKPSPATAEEGTDASADLRINWKRFFKTLEP